MHGGDSVTRGEHGPCTLRIGRLVCPFSPSGDSGGWPSFELTSSPHPGVSPSPRWAGHPAQASLLQQEPPPAGSPQTSHPACRDLVPLPPRGRHPGWLEAGARTQEHTQPVTCVPRISLTSGVPLWLITPEPTCPALPVPCVSRNHTRAQRAGDEHMTCRAALRDQGPLLLPQAPPQPSAGRSVRVVLPSAACLGAPGSGEKTQAVRKARRDGNRTQRDLRTAPAHHCVTLDNSLGRSDPGLHLPVES